MHMPTLQTMTDLVQRGVDGIEQIRVKHDQYKAQMQAVADGSVADPAELQTLRDQLTEHEANDSAAEPLLQQWATVVEQIESMAADA